MYQSFRITDRAIEDKSGFLCVIMPLVFIGHMGSLPRMGAHQPGG
jgi:hypothetical protein